MVQAQISVVIPLTKSRIDFIDLRYALRSIEKNLKNHGEIYIIGEKPNWITGVNHIPFTEERHARHKEYNIFNKVLSFFEREDTEDRIFFTNDDIVFLQECDALSYPNYVKGSLKDSADKNMGEYKITLNQTRFALEKEGLRSDNFDIHRPIVYEKERFHKLEKFDFRISYGYGVKSMYGNLNRLEHILCEDCKINRKVSKQEAIDMCQGKEVVSFTDPAIRFGLGEYLNDLFPQKSKYEK